MSPGSSRLPLILLTALVVLVLTTVGAIKLFLVRDGSAPPVSLWYPSMVLSAAALHAAGIRDVSANGVLAWMSLAVLQFPLLGTAFVIASWRRNPWLVLGVFAVLYAAAVGLCLALPATPLPKTAR